MARLHRTKSITKDIFKMFFSKFPLHEKTVTNTVYYEDNKISLSKEVIVYTFLGKNNLKFFVKQIKRGFNPVKYYITVSIPHKNLKYYTKQQLINMGAKSLSVRDFYNSICNKDLEFADFNIVDYEYLVIETPGKRNRIYACHNGSIFSKDNKFFQVI